MKDAVGGCGRAGARVPCRPVAVRLPVAASGCVPAANAVPASASSRQRYSHLPLTMLPAATLYLIMLSCPCVGTLRHAGVGGDCDPGPQDPDVGRARTRPALDQGKCGGGAWGVSGEIWAGTDVRYATTSKLLSVRSRASRQGSSFATSRAHTT